VTLEYFQLTKNIRYMPLPITDSDQGTKDQASMRQVSLEIQ